MSAARRSATAEGRSGHPGERRSPRHLLAVAAALLLLAAAGSAHAARSTERTRQKQAAETQRAVLREKLAALKRDIGQTEAARSHAADALAQSEAAISEANLSLRELAEEQREVSARVAALAKEQAALEKTVARQQSQLSRLLRDQYAAGNEDRLKLLLSGDNPNRINRDLQYMGYVSRAQAQLIEQLRANLQAAERNKAQAQEAKDVLDDIAREEREQKSVLEREKARRATLLAQLSGKLTAQRREAGGMERDEQRLAGLVDRLGRLIEEQRKTDEAAAARRREQLAQQAARAHAEREERRRQQAAVKSSGKAASALTQDNPDAIDADENPSRVVARNELTPEPGVQSGVFPASFAALRGQLRLPVKGELVSKFGSRRTDGPGTKGLFIRTQEGADVRAVAGGRVVFAEWLRGFGNLLIIDHGGQYLTIYGNNQAVLRRAGDAVKSGDVIASAGNSGGSEQSGLYFEMRHQGRAFDPLGWVMMK